MIWVCLSVCVFVFVCVCVCYTNFLYSLITIPTLATVSVKFELINVCVHLYFASLKA